MESLIKLDWNFLFSILEGMGFPTQLLAWLRICVTIPKISVAINRGLFGYFSRAKGVWQGDPQSPYLFVLANGSSFCLNKAAARGVFSYHPRCKGIQLTHLRFADDLIVFPKDTPSSAITIHSILEKFYTMSSLPLNCSKSELYCSGISNHDLCLIQTSTASVRYFWVPLTPQKLSENNCAPLVDRITSKIRSWGC